MSWNTQPQRQIDMSDKTKSFWSGSIVTMVMGSLVIGVFSMFGWTVLQASHIPTLQAEFKTNILHLNKNMVNLNSTGRETNQRILGLTVQLSEFATALVITEHQLQEVKKDCDKNTLTIEKNKHTHTL